MNKKILSMVLAVLMIFGMVPNFVGGGGSVKAADIFDPDDLNWTFPYRCQDHAISFEAFEKPINVKSESRKIEPIINSNMLNKAYGDEYPIFITIKIYNEQAGNRIIYLPYYCTPPQKLHNIHQADITKEVNTTLYYGDKIDVSYDISEEKPTYEYDRDNDSENAKYVFDNFPSCPLVVVGEGVKINSTLKISDRFLYDSRTNKSGYIPEAITSYLFTNTLSKKINVTLYEDRPFVDKPVEIKSMSLMPEESRYHSFDPRFSTDNPTKIVLDDKVVGFTGEIHEATPNFPDAEPKDKANLEAYKEAAKDKIGKLTNLSYKERGKYNDAIDYALDKARIDEIVEEAEAKSAAYAKAKEGLAKAKVQAKKDIAAMPELTPDQIKGYQDRVDQAATIEAVQAIVDEAKKASDTAVASKNEPADSTLEKDEGELKNYTVIDRDSFKEKSKELNLIPQERLWLTAFSLKYPKKEYRPKSSPFKFLEPTDSPDKEFYDFHLFKADGLVASKTGSTTDYHFASNNKSIIASVDEDVYPYRTYVDNSGKKYAVRIFKDKTESRTKTYSIVVYNPDNTTQDNILNKAKEEAIAKIDALQNLTEDEKAPFKTRINEAKDVPTIDKVVSEATAEDTKKGSLKEAKLNAKTAIEKLENIKPEDKTAALKAVEDAKTTEAVATALEDAMKKDSLEKAKKAAIAEVNALPNLSDTEKTEFAGKINAVDAVDKIAPIVEDAKKKDASNLKAAKDAAKAEVEALKNLTPTEKKDFTDRIDAVTKIADIKPIVDEAKTKDKENNDIAIGDVGGLIKEDPTIPEDKKKEATDKLNGKTTEELLTEAKKIAKNIINNLPNLSDTEKAAFVAKVDEATTIPAVKQVVEDAKAKSAENTKAANEKKALDEAKQKAKNEINALKNLTPEEKAAFTKRVDEATKVEEIQPIVDEAKAADAKKGKIVEAGDLIDQDPDITDKDKAKEDLKNKTDEEILKAAKDIAKNIIGKLPNLSDKDKGAFIKKVDDATTIPEVKKAVEEAKALDAAKKNAKDAIDKLANLDETAKNKAKEDITNAPDEAAVNKIVEDATAEDKKIADAKKTLDEQKQAAKDEIAKLPNLSKDEVKDFNKKVDDATDKAGIDKALEEAKAKSAENTKAAEDKKALDAAKQKAKDEINALPNLNETEKAQYNKAVDEAINQAGIDKALAEAKAKDKEKADAKTLEEAKETAKGVIDKLDNLSQEDKDKAKSDIDNAPDKAAIDKIVEGAKTKDKAEADRKAEEAKKAEELQKAKDAAKAEIEALKNLTPTEKKDFTDRIDKATKIEEIQPIVDAAKAKDLEKLNAAKKEAKDAIDNNEDIDPTKKDEIKEEIDKADTIDKVNEIVDKNTLTPEQKAAKELAKAKEEAKKEINVLPNLSNEEKAKYCSDVDNATDKAGVEKALTDAKNKDAENAKAADDKKALDEAKAKAKAEIEALPELTPEQKKAFEEEVDKATTPEAIKEIVDRAKEASDKAIADKQTLDEAKDAAKKVVDTLENLSQEEKDEAKKAIDAATDKAGVDAALDAAKKLDELNKAKKDAKAEIDSDPNLPQDKKDKAKEDIDNAPDKPAVDKIVEDAKNEGKTAEEKKALEDAKNKAKDEIDKLNNLTQEEKDKAKSDIDNATDKSAVDKIVEEATAKDKTKADENKKSLDDKKNDAKKDVDNLGNLDDKDKQDAKDAIDKATTPEEVDKALEDAKNKDLDKAKDKAKKTIDELDKITDGQKEKGKDAVNNAKTVEEVKTIVEELERKNYENSIPSPAPNPDNKDNKYVNDYYYGDEGAYMRKPVKEEKKTEEVKKPETAPAPTPSQAQLNLANVLKWIFKIDSPVLTKMMTRTSEIVTMDVAPFIRDNKTMLPLRYVAQTLGANVEWNATTRTATFTRNGLSASIQIDGNKIVMSDGRTVQMMAKPANVKARIFVPLTDVSKVFGLTNGNVTDGVNQNIEWNGTARTVEIYTNR